MHNQENSAEGHVLLINKPLDWTSFNVVKKLKYKLQVKKIGHAGTLDPLATGLLILCTGKMTKQIERFQAQEKEYTGTFHLGQTTASYDLETKPENTKPFSHLEERDIIAATKNFIGNIEQIPPIFSAVKVDGQRAYKAARQGKSIEIKSRMVEITEFEITRIKLPQIEFRVVCSKGTYIRSLANDFGKTLGVGAYLSSLIRTRIGNYKLSEATTIENATLDQ